MTVREAISKIKASMKEVSGDTILSNRLVYSHLVSSLQLLLERNKWRSFSTGEYKRIETELINLAEVSCVPIDCMVCRAKIGTPVVGKSGPLIGVVGSDDLFKTFSVTTPYQYQKKVQIDPYGLYAFYENGYIYLSECIPCIKVGMIEDATQSEGCGVLDTVFNIPGYLEDSLFKMTVQNLGMFLQKPLDITQNTNPNG